MTSAQPGVRLVEVVRPAEERPQGALVLLEDPPRAVFAFVARRMRECSPAELREAWAEVVREVREEHDVPVGSVYDPNRLLDIRGRKPPVVVNLRGREIKATPTLTTAVRELYPYRQEATI
jgi:hypothetical protein